MPLHSTLQETIDKSNADKVKNLAKKKIKASKAATKAVAQSEEDKVIKKKGRAPQPTAWELGPRAKEEVGVQMFFELFREELTQTYLEHLAKSISREKKARIPKVKKEVVSNN